MATQTSSEFHRLTILYGSQTGTAQSFAEQLYRESKCYHFRGPVLPMDSVDVKLLIEERFVVFVCSTMGQGDEPDNMRIFWRFLLRKSLPADSLQHLNFAVFGLGDSSYAKFNYVAKRLHRRLLQLGAKPMLPIGLADEQHDMGHNAIAQPWATALWRRLEELSPIPVGLTKLATSPRQFRWNVRIAGNNNSAILSKHANMYESCEWCFGARPVQATTSMNTRTTSDTHTQDVRLIGFDVGVDISWQPGDVLLIRPCNSDERVTELFDLLAEHELPFNADTVIEVDEIDAEMPVPRPLCEPRSLRQYASQYWDLNSCPRRRVFELLALNSDNDIEREKLIELTTAAGEQDFFDYVTRPRRNIVEILHDFPHSTARLNLETIFELFEPIQPRSFSIASSAKSGRLDILVAVVEYRTKLKMSRRGLCSWWLRNLRVGDTLRASIKAGTIRLPSDGQTPIVMVGPGTGLAMFRSILQEEQLSLLFLSKCDVRSNKHHDFPRLTLFFGCRNEQSDFHCSTELKQMQTSGILELFTAFSRDQDHKVYVQHCIREQHILLRRLIIDGNGYFIVSGSSKNMPQAVREALTEALGDANLVENMLKNGRYQEETWA